MICGIDASNIRSGGGLTHLQEFLGNATPSLSNFERVLVWGGDSTLDALPDKPWLEKISIPALDGSIVSRSHWQTFEFSKELRRNRCDVALIPGGLYIGGFRPFVAMFQNSLPFEPEERNRYGLSRTGIRLHAIRYLQSLTFRRADGIIYLSQYARQLLERSIGPMGGLGITIPHGVTPRFRRPDNSSTVVLDRSVTGVWLYVSDVTLYKHQWNVVEAFGNLHRQGYAVELKLVGAARNTKALGLLQAAVERAQSVGLRVNFLGQRPYHEINRDFLSADGFVFASSCENLPIILLEAMAAGLPIACSNRGPMPEILGDSGGYFDPQNSHDIAEAVRSLIDNPIQAREFALSALRRSSVYDWAECANSTFKFLAEVSVARNSGQRLV